MKRRGWVWFCGLILALSFGLMACSSPQKELRETAERFLEAVKALDPEEISSFFLDTGAVTEDEDGFDMLEAYLKEANGKLTYEILEADVQAGTVSVHCSYIDSTEFVGNFLVELISAAFGGRLEETMSDAQLEEAYGEMIEAARKDLKDVFKEVDLVLSFEKQEKGWLLKEPDDALWNLMTANCAGALESIGGEIQDSLSGEGKYPEYDANIRYTGQLADCGVLLKLKNENSTAVGTMSIRVMFESESGELLELGSGYLEFLEPGEEAYVPVYYYGTERPAGYSVSLSCMPQSGYENGKEQIAVEHTDGEDGVLARLTNHSDHTMTQISAVVLYYQGEALVGFEQADTYNVNAGAESTLEFLHPVDLRYEDVAYDRYELMVTQAYYMAP